MSQTQFNLDKIPAADVRALSHTILNAVKKFYEDPQHVKEAEAWIQKQKEEVI